MAGGTAFRYSLYLCLAIIIVVAIVQLADNAVFQPYVLGNAVDLHPLVVILGVMGGAGGGISLHTGADNYAVENNWVCGNHSQGGGAGIGHLGVSDNGLIADNFVIFNESFSQGSFPSGGGIFVGGQTPLGGGDTSPTPTKDRLVNRR